MLLTAYELMSSGATLLRAEIGEYISAICADAPGAKQFVDAVDAAIARRDVVAGLRAMIAVSGSQSATAMDGRQLLLRRSFRKFVCPRLKRLLDEHSSQSDTLPKGGQRFPRESIQASRAGPRSWCRGWHEVEHKNCRRSSPRLVPNPKPRMTTTYAAKFSSAFFGSGVTANWALLSASGA
jgi:hypothetical protein